MASWSTILVGAGGDQALGVFRGCKYTDSNSDVIYSASWPNGTVTSDAVAFVVDDPNALFEVQSVTLAQLSRL